MGPDSINRSRPIFLEESRHNVGAAVQLLGNLRPIVFVNQTDATQWRPVAICTTIELHHKGNFVPVKVG